MFFNQRYYKLSQFGAKILTFRLLTQRYHNLSQIMLRLIQQEIY